MNGRLKVLLAVVAAAAAVLAGQPAHARGRHRKRRLLVTFNEGTTRAQREQAARDMGLTLADDLDELEAAVLEAPGDVGPAETAKAKKHAGVLQVQEDVYRNWLLETPVYAALPSVSGIWQTLGRPKLKIKPVAPPEDQAGPSSSNDPRIPWGVARVAAPAAWKQGQGRGIKVAVIDTGVDCSHPDLQCDFSQGANILDPGADPMDDNEHGTHVSGTIAGRGNGSGLLGVAPQATIIPVKVLDKDGAGSLSDIVKGINWATKAGVDVINMSLGGDTGSAALERAVNKALKAGIVIVAAAGNSGPGPDTVGYPGGYPGVIAVAASDSSDKVAKFSSRGDAVAVIAPGVDVKSTVPGGGYATESGTSMASPHVAGLAALAIERGARGPSGVRSALLRASTRLCSVSACAGPTEQGAGLPVATKL
jgi:subtilisin